MIIGEGGINKTWPLWGLWGPLLKMLDDKKLKFLSIYPMECVGNAQKVPGSFNNNWREMLAWVER